MGCIQAKSRLDRRSGQLIQSASIAVGAQDDVRQYHALMECFYHALELVDQVGRDRLPDHQPLRLIQDQILQLQQELAARVHATQGPSADDYHRRIQTLWQSLVTLRASETAASQSSHRHSHSSDEIIVFQPSTD